MHRPIKTVILALCAALLVAATVPAAGRPKAVVVEPLKDAGTVKKGEQIAHDFLIRNEGDAALEVTSVQPAAGCTVTEFDQVIAPGGTGKVRTVLDTSAFAGPITRVVRVFTNDPDTPKLELAIRATVEPYIAVKPGFARYITVQAEPQEGTIVQTLWALDGSPVEITGVESPWPFLAVTYREARPEERLAGVEGKQWRVEMKLSNDARVGALADHVTIHTNHPKQAIVQIPVSGFVRPVIAVTPPVADFGTFELKGPLHKVLNIRSFATEPIKVTSIEQNVKGIDTKIEPLTEGREYQVRFILNPELGKGPFHGRITIRTDSPKVPVLEVEMKGTVL